MVRGSPSTLIKEITVPNNTGGSRRPKWLNAYRAFTTIVLVAVAVMGVIGLHELSNVSDRSFAPISVEQADKVKTAASFLETAGFADPVYLGIKPATEGEFPTFRVVAIGGQSVEVFIRTTKNGGLQIQPTMIFQTVGSADDFARLATDAVFMWKNMPPSIKPRTDGAWGEYETRKYNFDNLSKYAADYGAASDETAGWPHK